MWNLIIGFMFIIGGVSGTLALKGTGSTSGLAVVGVGLVVWGFIQLNSSKPKGKVVSRNGRKTISKPNPSKRYQRPVR